jgi:hypothetical protein
MSDVDRLKVLVKEFFDGYLDYTETKGEDDHTVHPIQITCCRAMMSKHLSDLLAEMKELSHK